MACPAKSQIFSCKPPRIQLAGPSLLLPCHCHSCPWPRPLLPWAVPSSHLGHVLLPSPEAGWAGRRGAGGSPLPWPGAPSGTLPLPTAWLVPQPPVSLQTWEGSQESLGERGESPLVATSSARGLCLEMPAQQALPREARLGYLRAWLFHLDKSRWREL